MTSTRLIKQMSSESSVGVAAVTYAEDVHDHLIVVDFVNDPVVSNTNPVKSIVPTQLGNARWTRLIFEVIERRSKPVLNVGIELAERFANALLDAGRYDEDFVESLALIVFDYTGAFADFD